jgi:hypothetical protein
MSKQQEVQAEVRPDLFLPRHPGDVVRLVAALAVLLVSIKLVNRTLWVPESRVVGAELQVR